MNPVPLPGNLNPIVKLLPQTLFQSWEQPTLLDTGVGGGGGTTSHPFFLSDATSEGVAKVHVTAGMVSTVTPTGMSPLDGLELTVSASGYVVLGVTTDGYGVAESAEIEILASVPADSLTIGKIALGYVTRVTTPSLAVTCTQNVSGSLWHQRCETVHLFGRV